MMTRDDIIHVDGDIDKVDWDVDIMPKRIPMEQQTDKAYWHEMHDRYDTWIDNFNSCPVLRLDINDYDLMKDPQTIEHILERIAHFMEQTSHLRRR